MNNNLLLTIANHTYQCVLRWGQYSNGRLALILLDETDGQPVSKVTVNLVDEELASDEIALNHELTEEWEAAMVKHGWINPSHRTVQPSTSWVDFRICRLTTAGLAAAQEA
jgi:hypothetical protein